MTKVRLGVLGCADIAIRRILPALAGGTMPGIELIAVASRYGRKARETAARFGATAVTGYGELLALTGVDAVYVPLPAALHAAWVEAALRAGKHVLVEKPMTTSLARTAELLTLADTLGLVAMENVMFVHHGQHAIVRALVADGLIGNLRAVEASFLVPRPPSGHIRFSAELGGGALWEVGIYPVQTALYFLGPDLDIAGAVLTVGPGERVDSMGAALLRSPDGIPVQVAFGIDHSYHCAYQLIGSAGRIEVERAYTPPAGHRPVLRVANAAGTVTERRLPAEDQVAAALAAFAAAVLGNAAPSRATRAPGADQAFHANQILARAAILDRLSSYVRAAHPAKEGT